MCGDLTCFQTGLDFPIILPKTYQERPKPQQLASRVSQQGKPRGRTPKDPQRQLCADDYSWCYWSRTFGILHSWRNDRQNEAYRIQRRDQLTPLSASRFERIAAHGGHLKYDEDSGLQGANCLDLWQGL